MKLRLDFTLLALGASLALASPGAFGAPSVDGPRVLQTGDLGVDVTLRYQLQPAAHPGGEDDPGPFLGSGEVAITAGTARANSIFPLASLDALAPNLPQNFPTDAATRCGSAGPMAIEKLDGSAYPAVVVTTVILVKGCLPLAHVFVPLDATSTTYQRVVSYDVAHRVNTFRGEGRMFMPRSDGSLKVTRIRQITLPNPPKGDAAGITPWTIAIIDGLDENGKPATIALDRPKPDETPDTGETVSIYNSHNADLLPVIRLSWGHEEHYQQLHPSPKVTAP
jgi:hypothetical protein